MCGIAGILQTHGQHGLVQVRAMTDALAHRGPDGEGSWSNEGATVLLGHRRLAILDLSPAASQPMPYNDRYILVHNGELYNYREVRSVLETKGYTFRTSSDSEVILAAYAEYGSDCLQHFDGMFAFAIWDQQENSLFAARDRFGEKPFYYHYNTTNDLFCFASEPKALFAAGVDAARNETAWLGFLSGTGAQPLSDPSQTYFRHVLQLPPAHSLKAQIRGDRIRITLNRYWRHEPDPIALDPDAASVQLQQQLAAAVSMRMRSDVPVGTSLSGGIDSAGITALIQQQGAGFSNYSHKTFTAVFPGFEKDESRDAAAIAAWCQSENFTTAPDAAAFSDRIEALVRHHEEPIGSASVYAQYAVFQLAKENGVKVLLDGQGADELLGGYERYLHWFLQEQFSNGQWGRFRKEQQLLQQQGYRFDWNWKNYAAAFFPRKAAAALSAKTANRIRTNRILHPDFIQSAFAPELTFKPEIRSLNEILEWTTCHKGLNELLRYADRNAMAHGVEVRLPFLQHDLASWLLNLPATLKIRNGYTKWILRRSLAPLLPEKTVWNSGKTAFEPPQLQWMQQQQVRDRIRAAKEKGVSNGYLNKTVLETKEQPHTAYAADGADWRIWMAGILW